MGVAKLPRKETRALKKKKRRVVDRKRKEREKKRHTSAGPSLMEMKRAFNLSPYFPII